MTTSRLGGHGFVPTILGVALGTVAGAFASAAAGFFVGLIILSVVSDDTGIASEQGINVVAGVLGGIGVGVTTAFFVQQFLERPRSTGLPNFRASRQTARAAGALNGAAVLVTFLITAFAMPNAAGNIIGRFWTWPLWFVGVAFLARWVALAADRHSQ